MKGEIKGDANYVMIRSFIQQGIQRVELRDEIFCQLIRQTSCNPQKKACVRAWQLMLISCVSFQPSNTFRKVYMYLGNECTCFNSFKTMVRSCGPYQLLLTGNGIQIFSNKYHFVSCSKTTASKYTCQFHLILVNL